VTGWGGYGLTVRICKRRSGKPVIAASVGNVVNAVPVTDSKAARGRLRPPELHPIGEVRLTSAVRADAVVVQRLQDLCVDPAATRDRDDAEKQSTRRLTLPV